MIQNEGNSTPLDALTREYTKPDAVDALSLNFETASQLSTSQRTALLLRASSSGSIRSIADLTRRALEYIHVSSLGSSATTLRTLNRRFGRVASRHHTTIQEVVLELTERGAIVLLESRGRRALYSDSVWKAQSAYLVSEGADVSEVMERLVSSAQ